MAAMADGPELPDDRPRMSLFDNSQTQQYPSELFMMQVASDVVDGFLLDKRNLILDWNTEYSTAFRSLLEREGIEMIQLPPRSPNLNAYAERFVRSIKEEALSRIIFFAEASLRRASVPLSPHAGQSAPSVPFRCH